MFPLLPQRSGSDSQHEKPSRSSATRSTVSSSKSNKTTEKEEREQLEILIRNTIYNSLIGRNGPQDANAASLNSASGPSGDASTSAGSRSSVEILSQHGSASITEVGDGKVAALLRYALEADRMDGIRRPPAVIASLMAASTGSEESSDAAGSVRNSSRIGELLSTVNPDDFGAPSLAQDLTSGHTLDSPSYPSSSPPSSTSLHVVRVHTHPEESTDVVVDHVTSTRWSSLEMFKSENEDLIQRLEQIAGVSSGIGGLLSTKSALIGGDDDGTVSDAFEADEVDTASSVDGTSESTGSAPVANPKPRFAQGITLPRFTQRLPKPPAAAIDAAASIVRTTSAPPLAPAVPVEPSPLPSPTLSLAGEGEYFSTSASTGSDTKPGDPQIPRNVHTATTEAGLAGMPDWRRISTLYRKPTPSLATAPQAVLPIQKVDLTYLVTSESKLAETEASERIPTKPAPRHFRHTSLPSATLLLSDSVPVQSTLADDEPPPARATDSSTPTTQPTIATASTSSAVTLEGGAATPHPRSVVWADRCGWPLEVHHDYAEYLDRVITLRELRLHELMLRRRREEGAAAGPAVWGGFGGSSFVFGPPPSTASGAATAAGGSGRSVSGAGAAAAAAVVSGGPPLSASAAAAAASITVSSAAPPAHSGGLFSLLPSTTAPYSFG
ncbi:hypothetical protein HK405_010067 [Cladochytrium tenue]|nr:hypothetical protein HK405_010067 [Cladochytrium tenue]